MIKAFKDTFLISINTESRIYGLDIFRAISILLVLKIHANELIQHYFPGLRASMGIGGPELFFVLSGYLIGQILIKQVEKNGSFNIHNAFIFLKRRWFRTLPNYFLFLGFHFLMILIVEHNFQLDFVKYSVFLQNFSQPIEKFFPESWSLSLEEWFYIFYALFLVLVLGFRPIKNIPKRILFSILSFIIIIFTIRIAYYIFTFEEGMNPLQSIRTVTVARIDSLMIGVLAAYLKIYFRNFWYRAKWIKFILGICLIYIVYFNMNNLSDSFLYIFSFPLVSIGATLLLSAADQKVNFKSNWGKWITHISMISYSLYLTNIPIMRYVIGPIEQNFNIEPALLIILYLVLNYIIASLIYKYFEKPMMNLRERFQ